MGEAQLEPWYYAKAYQSDASKMIDLLQQSRGELQRDIQQGPVGKTFIPKDKV